eukprot:CAMPEP_0172598066 /NCGR_PEP_ID=MMETSP1068-20121228/18067_1 /TAXON_ID=35684 /ORGANISM="Pseudopedinella elastica, Strain CCMP716" /LENGTH=43 /DNA_ID= /DNA_START= /DNA_END= /DNA_ORIENTATION=
MASRDIQRAESDQSELDSTAKAWYASIKEEALLKEKQMKFLRE